MTGMSIENTISYKIMRFYIPSLKIKISKKLNAQAHSTLQSYRYV